MLRVVVLFLGSLFGAGTLMVAGTTAVAEVTPIGPPASKSTVKKRGAKPASRFFLSCFDVFESLHVAQDYLLRIVESGFEFLVIFQFRER